MEHRIRIVDTETTGMEPPASKVVELGWCDIIQAPAGWEVGEPQSELYGVDAMPPEVRAVHHIGLAEVAGLEPFDQVRFWESCSDVAAVASHNWQFDSGFFGEAPLHAICTYKAALLPGLRPPGHSNGVLRYWLEDQGLLSLDHDKAMPPHRAGPDAYVTAHILKALFAAGATGREMIAWTAEPRLLPKCPIDGRLKEKGKRWPDVSQGLLVWIAGQESLGDDLRWNARRELERRAA